MRKLFEYLLLRCGYVRDVELIETQRKLREVDADLHVLRIGFDYACRNWREDEERLDRCQEELREALAEVGISRNLLTECARIRDELREELDITTSERDLAWAKLKIEETA